MARDEGKLTAAKHMTMMKTLMLGLVAVFDCIPAVAAQPTLSEAVSQDNLCMVRQAYALSPAAQLEVSQRQAVVETCITFEQGSQAWYLREHIRRGTPVDPESEDARSVQAATRRLSSNYLQQALARCASAQADEQTCLVLLHLVNTEQ